MLRDAAANTAGFNIASIALSGQKQVSREDILAVAGITGRTSFAWISPTETLEQVGNLIFRLEPRFQLSPALAILTIVVLIAGSAWILERRVRGIEVVQ